jgi:Flp pilus assembly protein TadG
VSFLSSTLDSQSSECEDETKSVVEMFRRKRSLVSQQPESALLPAGLRLLAATCTRGEQGGAMIEFALTLPILMLLVTAFVSFGTLLEQDLQLTDAVNVGAKVLAISRGNTTDPCSLVYSTVTTAAPYLSLTSSDFSYNFNGNQQSGSSCNSASTSSGAAGELVQGQPVTITVKYPCSLSTFYGVLAPSGSCFIQAQLTEMVQ